jgi:hypothetical protein
MGRMDRRAMHQTRHDAYAAFGLIGERNAGASARYRHLAMH